jgi:hypothetical protein
MVSVDSGSEQTDESVERIFFHVVVKIPDRLDNRVASDDPVCPPHQELQEPKLGWAEMNFLAPSEHLVRRGVQDQIRYLKGSGTWNRPSSCDRAKAGQKYLKGERLGQIVVRARIKTLHYIRRSITRRKHQDRRLILVSAEPASHLETIYPGKH